MKAFMDKDFLLDTATAQRLYHDAAATMPIFDYHCHLVPQEIAENKTFANLTEMWLGADHYKWRQMRTYGIAEELITGKTADPYSKFLAWAETVENLMGNPLYHWTHLELQRYFGIYEPLTVQSAPEIWKKANALLQTPELSVKGIFKKFKVYAVGTTDDPADDLAWHKLIAEGKAPIGKIETKVLPSFRPDKALNIDAADFAAYVKKLGEAAGMSINSVADVIKALTLRLDFFVSLGCRASDHALEYPPFVVLDNDSLEAVFKKALQGGSLSSAEIEGYKTAVLTALAAEYNKRNVAMQLHFAVIRNNNKRLFDKLGPDTGLDASADDSMSRNLAALLSRMDQNGLPKTILYTLNPKDYYPIGTIMGAFQGQGRGKVQLGSAWWFLDHKDGMTEQMKILGNVGMLSAFVGMLTDSRSFLSYPRHEYFRRIMCNLIGGWVENGEYPAHTEKLMQMVKNISFTNAQQYFE